MFQKIFSIFLIFILTFSNSFADLENSLTFKEIFEKKTEINFVASNFDKIIFIVTIIGVAKNAQIIHQN
jgi:hypothetical protein